VYLQKALYGKERIMSKLAHSSDMCKCRTCGDSLDVWVRPEERFCNPTCEAVFKDRHNGQIPLTYEDVSYWRS